VALASLLAASPDPEAGAGLRRRLDIWVVGSLDDALYRSLLFPLAVIARELVFEEYAAFFRYHDPVHNARFRLRPLALAVNLSALPQAERREVAELAARLELWGWHPQDGLAANTPVRPPAIPRFLLLEGVAGAGQLTAAELETSAVGLLALVLVSGGNCVDLLDEYLGFPKPGAPEDFVSSLALASLEFPVAFCRDYCVAHSVIRIADRLLDESTSGDEKEQAEQLQGRFRDLLRETEIDRLQRRLLFTADDEDPREEVSERTPDFVLYDSRQDGGPQGEGVPAPSSSRLEAQGTFLPRVKGTEKTETLAGFFGRFWRRYPGSRLRCEGTAQPVKQFYEWIRAIDRRGLQTETDLRQRLRRAVDESLGELTPERSLRGLMRVLDKQVLPEFEARANSAGQRVRSALPVAPTGRGFLAFAAELGLRIWERPPLGNILFWLLPLTAAFAMAWWFVLPSPGAWATQYLPALKDFYTADPLRHDPLRAWLPGAAQALLAGACSVVLLSFYRLARSRRRIRELTRSPLPLLAEARRQSTRAGASAPEPGQGHRRRVEAATRSQGPLAKELAGMREQFRAHWDSRLERAAELGTHRVLAALRRDTIEQLERLETREREFAALRERAVQRLRHMGEPRPGTPRDDAPPTAYPGDTALRRYLLSSTALPRFYEREAAGSGGVAGQQLLDAARSGRAIGAESVERACEALFPLLSENGIFAMGEFDQVLRDQLVAFARNLPELLIPGEHLHYLASREPDGGADRTQIAVFCASHAAVPLEQAVEDLASGIRVVDDSADPHRVYALRMTRGVEPETLAAHLGVGLRIRRERVEASPGSDPMPAGTSPWRSNPGGP
jgi:hypothetical protein